jgi:FKBP-type peptidyl-prolyl cis-trans isomerase
MKSSIFSMFALIFVLFAVASCGSAGEMKTKSGFKIIFQEKGKGKKAEPRDWVYFRYSVSIKDSILDFTKEGQPDNRLQLPDQITSAEPSYYVLEAFEMSSIGDSFTLYVPISVIPGPKPEMFGENDTLVYGFKITDIKDQEAYEADMERERLEFEEKQKQDFARFEEIKVQAEQMVKDAASGKFNSQLIDAGKGLKVYMVEEGEGEAIQEGNIVNAHYIGMLENLTVFDASFPRGQPISFEIGTKQVIEGWEEGFKKLKKNSKALLIIPPGMGYGNREQGMIPANSTLYFYVEVESFN